MKAIVVTDEAAGTARMTLVERPEPDSAINDVVVPVHASGFTSGELTWPSTWTDRLDRDRTPSIPGHELAGLVTALGYGTRGLSVGQRVFGLADWHRDGTPGGACGDRGLSVAALDEPHVDLARPDTTAPAVMRLVRQDEPGAGKRHIQDLLRRSQLPRAPRGVSQPSRRNESCCRFGR